MVKARKAKPPKVESDEWIRQEQSRPAHVLWTIQHLNQLTAEGCKWAPEALMKWIERFPHIAKTLRHIDDLCAAAEGAWLAALAGDDQLHALAIKDEIAQMKTELAGEKPSLLDRVMVSNVVTAYPAQQRAVIMAAKPTEHDSVAAARDRRAESTARRLLSAVRGLALVREMMTRGRAPRAKLKVFEAG